MASSEMLRRVALVRTDVSEVPFIRVARIGELGTTGARIVRRLLIKARFVPSSPIPATLMPVLQDPHSVTSQKRPFFIVTTVKTSNIKHRENILLFLMLN
jgi:hypothetical protein